MPRWFTPAAVVCGLMFAISPILIAQAPYESTMGLVQKIFYVHLPSALVFLTAAIICGVASARYLFSNDSRQDRIAWAAAELVMVFGIITLVTGPLWARKAWGTWWVWDARMTSTLILMFLYIGFISLQAAIDDPRKADRAGAVLALVGVINVPIIYFSVNWWNTLHQGATTRILQKPTIRGSMLAALLIMLAACWLYSVAVVLMRLRCIILEREQNAARFAEVGV